MAILKDEIRTARKEYSCGAYYWFDRSNYGPQDIEPEDWKIIEAVRADDCLVKPGMRYLYQAIVDGDGFGEFRARLDMHQICLLYGLYPQD